MNRKIIVYIIMMLLLTVNIFITSGNEEIKNKQEKYYSTYLNNFELDVFSGGFAPWTPLYRIQIDQNGQGIYSIMPAENRGVGGFTIIDEFDLTENEMNQLWDTINNNGYFDLDNLYSTISGDGTFANMTITNGKSSHSVETRNIAVLGFDNIVKEINTITPGNYDLIYNAIINVQPNKPSEPMGQSSGNIKEEYTYTTSAIDENLDDIYYWFDWGDGTNSGWIGPFESGEIASATNTWDTQGSYNITVQAKDDPNGDGDLSDGFVSFWSDPLPITMPKIKIRNRFFIELLTKMLDRFSVLGFLVNFIDEGNTEIILNNIAEPSGTRVSIKECKITVDIYIQIVGPGATVALTQTIETDIEDMWNTDKDGNKWMIKCKEDCDPREPGCSVEFDAHVVRMDEMHRLPGFHTWTVGQDPAGTNHGAQVTMWDYDGDGVGDGPTGNDQVIPTTTGRVDDNEPDNTYAHEAGHLMGLQDQYEEVGEDDNGNGVIDPDERETKPKPGHEGDIMGTLDGKPLQSAIDEIVDDAGIECPCECCPEEEDDEDPENNIMTPGDGSSVTNPVNVEGEASDIGGSGIAEFDYKLDWDGGTYEGSSRYFDPPIEETGYTLGPIYLDVYIDPDDWITITTYAIDAAGNIGEDSITVTWVEDEEDNTPPVTEKTIGEPNADGGYLIYPITPITFDATDDMSGVNYIHYEIWWDSDEDMIVDTQMADQTVYSDSLTFTVGDFGVLYGFIELRWFAVDNADNIEITHYQEHFVQGR